MAARSRSAMTGRLGHLRVLTLTSLLTATISTSPSAAASVRQATWPTWRRSKQPLVKTIVLPWERYRSMSETSAERVVSLAEPRKDAVPRGGEIHPVWAGLPLGGRA